MSESLFTKLARKSGRVAVIGAVTLGVLGGIAGTASAAPAQNGGSLAIQKAGSTSKVYVNGVISMTQADAYRYIGQMKHVEIKVFGDDPGDADAVLHTDTNLRSASLPAQVPGQYLYAGADGLHYHREFVVESKKLNEDNGFWDDTDEIYAQATLVDTSGAGRLRTTTNVVVNKF